MSQHYLSRLVMPLDEALCAGLRDCYAWHKFIWESLPDRQDAKRDFLFRIDVKDRNVTALVLSAIPPRSESKFVTKFVPETFLDYNSYRFEIRVNPTIAHSCADGRKRRIGIYNEIKLHEWFNRKFNAIGCELKTIEIDHPRDEFFTKNGKRGKHVSVNAEGILTVHDANIFKDKFYNGIGHAKAFGFGMLMLQPINI